ncbi:MAG: Probable Co/Zn/Cd efflux system membrane fusion protein [uncultured Aureispira sp.]|uniref:Probable Co/Zn/Cd efflux system membrane fusion protein n=1 Tax=uncultured Aureispira sp. TaxID=1331704 RepID=A0A6S6U411_9BACT|nr:MAG: Probable Co/Zn/Cd efflux system membrane fusion protein [uncultured Aureispira sp.]
MPYISSFWIALLSLIFINTSLAQDDPMRFSGMVVNKADEPLIGATVNWINTTIGGATDLNGWFDIPRIDSLGPHLLEISYVGYETVQVEILPNEERLKLVVEDNATLADIVVEAKERSSFTSTLDPINLETIGTGELRRAACCNLSESFENNATVNVNFSDAVTGAKEIEMLGLRGTYTQMLIENRPSFNRLGRAYGLEYIPGTFIEAIQISKGASTVRNGVQGITGQINTELIKPYKAPLLFLNLFANYTGRVELNAQFNYRITKDWSTGLLMHGNYYGTEIDYNEDSFLDIPKKQQVNVISRWVYKPQFLHFEINVQGIIDNRIGGQTQATFQKIAGTPATRLYQVNSEIRRIGAFGKLGYLDFDNPNQSLAILYDANIHQHTSYFGDKKYSGLQKRFYANFVFQTNLGKTGLHNLSTGLNYDLIDFKEQFVDINNDRTEHLAAIYAEYDFTKKFNEDKGTQFGLILGLRSDLIHTQEFTKIYPSPRLNLKYNFSDDMVIRASAGRGVRTTNLLIENLKFMPSYKEFSIQETILPEVAWNYGLNFAWNIKISPKLEGSLNVDVYRTDFENQLVVDLDADPTYNTIQFYNLKGPSFANSILVSYTQDLVKGLEARIAYKLNDVRMTYGTVLHEMPLMPRHRGLMHLNYTTAKKDWEFNVTLNIIGPQRLPHLHTPYGDHLPDYRFEEYSPTYARLNAHISKFFKGGWQVYLGGENLTNYTQEQPILGYQDPFGTSTTNTYANFDATSVFAPVFGAQIYAGIKYTFEGKERFAPVQSCSSIPVVSAEAHLNPKDWLLESNQQRVAIKTSSQCGSCETILQEALYTIEGVERASLDIETQVLTVIYVPTQIDVSSIQKTISEAGYDADTLKANPEAHRNLPGCCQQDGGHRVGKTNYTLKTAVVKSSNQCGMCSKTIGDALFALEGVKNVHVDENAHTVTVQFLQEKTSLQKIKKAIQKAGYDADNLKANKAAYNKLNGCCKKPE